LPLLARAIVFNIGYNRAKDLFANPAGEEHTQIRVFCAVKCLISWNCEVTARICRERLGGGSYLAHAGIGQCIEAGHSGMTAEGDNRVLMQKVVKDILSDFQKKRHPMPKMTMCPRREIPKKDRVSDLATLTNLVYFRELAEIKSLTSAMQKMVMEDGKPFFDAWMYELSDE
jgi:acyl-CoA oxidase